MKREQRLEGALRGLLEQVQSLRGFELTTDIDTYKAEANWDDAIRHAEDELKDKSP